MSVCVSSLNPKCSSTFSFSHHLQSWFALCVSHERACSHFSISFSSAPLGSEVANCIKSCGKSNSNNKRAQSSYLCCAAQGQSICQFALLYAGWPRAPTIDLSTPPLPRPISHNWEDVEWKLQRHNGLYAGTSGWWGSAESTNNMLEMKRKKQQQAA